MALKNEFKKKLDDLWRRRTVEICSLVEKRKRGPSKQFNKKILKKRINQLQNIATKILTKQGAKEELKEIVNSRHLRHINGHGTDVRYKNLIRWVERNIDGPIIYSFWNGKKCLYIGQGKSWKRLKSYKKSIYLHQAKVLKIYCVNKGQLSKAECLSTHLFQPKDNIIKAPAKKWGKKCPICKAHDQIKNELLSLF